MSFWDELKAAFKGTKPVSKPLSKDKVSKEQDQEWLRSPEGQRFEAIRKDPKWWVHMERYKDENELTPEQLRERIAVFRSQSIADFWLRRRGLNGHEAAKLLDTGIHLTEILLERPEYKYDDNRFASFVRELDTVIKLLYQYLDDDANFLDQDQLYNLVLQQTQERLDTISKLRAGFKSMPRPTPKVSPPPEDDLATTLRKINDKAQIAKAVQKALAETVAAEAMQRAEFLELVRKEKPELEDELMDSYDRALFEARQKKKS